MTESEIQFRIEKLEGKLEQPPKTIWDILQSLAAILIPAAIAYVGYQVSQTQTAIQIHSAEQIADKEQAIARINAQVGQAQVVAAFIKSLLSTNVQEKEVAISAVLIALPEQGPQLVRAISQGDSSPAVKRFAVVSLEERRQDLIASVVGDDPKASRAAAEDLLKGWRSDTNLAARLVTAAEHNDTSTNALHSTLTVLQQLDVRQLQPHQSQIDRFVEKAQARTPAIRSDATRLQRRITPGR